MAPTIRDYGKLRMMLDLDAIKALPALQRRAWIDLLWADYEANNEINPLVFDAITCGEDMDEIVMTATGVSFWPDVPDVPPEDLVTQLIPCGPDDVRRGLN
jgi:hypothetical protein